MSVQLPETGPSVEFLLLADRAEAINGKLYLMGGAWDRLLVGDFAQPQAISIAVGVLVPWTATHEEHRLSARITDEDETEVANVLVGFRTGTPAQMQRTETQKVILAFQIQVKLQRPGTYVVRAVVNDDRERSRETFFYASPRPTQPAPMPR
jgi:hypothetical protein